MTKKSDAAKSDNASNVESDSANITGLDNSADGSEQQLLVQVDDLNASTSDSAVVDNAAADLDEQASEFSSPAEAEPVAPSITPAFVPPVVLFQAPAELPAPAARASRSAKKVILESVAADDEDLEEDDAPTPEIDSADDDDDASRPRRRRRGGRGRRRSSEREDGEETDTEAEAEAPSNDAEPAAADPPADDDDAQSEGGTKRRRRRRRGTGDDVAPSPDDPPQTVVKVREPRRRTRAEEYDDARSDVRSIKGSTRLEAKKQRRREGREMGRRRAPVITEAEFLARRESVERVMAVRQVEDRTQIAVLEDGILAEHYVNRASATSYVGNVYLGKVQNVLPSMEAAFVDIGKSRNAVLYAGEVNWDAANLEGQPRRIETALKPGDAVLVQVTKDPIGHKGARLTSQISLPGRFLVFVPDGQMTGISRKLPENERTRLKSILRTVLPEGAGVIVRTAAEGATEEELERDVARLEGQWTDISEKAATASAPALLHSEPDLTTRVIRDIFNEDFAKLMVAGDDAWEAVGPYVEHVAPDLMERVEKWSSDEDLFAAYRVDEQLAKALDRKVNLPSGGSLVIDRTEAMIVVDVNTGKFTGKGGNLEETVTRNNLEAAEEIVRQLRLRDLGGIIVIDFIDMVLESNRELVLRRLLECLGRDRTKHQVAEVTSLGLVQMTRKRVGQGLLEAFSETCETCAGRGVVLSTDATGRPIHLGEKHTSSPRRITAGGLSPDVLAKMPTPRKSGGGDVEDQPGDLVAKDEAPAPAEKKTRGRRARVRPERQDTAAASTDADSSASSNDEGAAEAQTADALATPAPAVAPAAQKATEAAEQLVMATAPQTASPVEAPETPRVRRPRRATRPAGSASAAAKTDAQVGES